VQRLFLLLSLIAAGLPILCLQIVVQVLINLIISKNYFKRISFIIVENAAEAFGEN